MGFSQGIFYIVATPIGNLDDITIRALDTLKSVNLCLAEDTRRTKKLFSHFEILTEIKSCYRHNEKNRVQWVIDRLKRGDSIALVSDAGMPGISDPGERLIREVISADLPVEAIPGACSPINALILSGMRLDRFSFEGFIPRKGNKRNKRLKKINDDDNTVILFESPLRILPLLTDLKKVCGNRRVAICRELTKKFEETVRGTISELVDMIDNKQLNLKGEMVVVVEGKDAYDKNVKRIKNEQNQ